MPDPSFYAPDAPIRVQPAVPPRPPAQADLPGFTVMTRDGPINLEQFEQIAAEKGPVRLPDGTSMSGRDGMLAPPSRGWMRDTRTSVTAAVFAGCDRQVSESIRPVRRVDDPNPLQDECRGGVFQ